MVFAVEAAARNSSALRVEWPIVQIRLAGIHQFPFNRRAGKHRPRRRQVDLQLLHRVPAPACRFSARARSCRRRALDETVERAAQNHLRGRRPHREWHLEERVARFERLRQRALPAQREICAARLVEHLLDIAGLDRFFVPNQPRKLVGDRLRRCLAGERRAEALEQPMHERAREAAAACVSI